MNLDVPHDVILDRVAGRLVVRFLFILSFFFTPSPPLSPPKNWYRANTPIARTLG